MTPSPPDEREAIVRLSEQQKQAIINARWIHSGGQDPIAIVDLVAPWPEGIAQFFTLTQDRLTPLGVAVRAQLLVHLTEQGEGYE